jgi:hypothetical protein
MAGFKDLIEPMTNGACSLDPSCWKRHHRAIMGPAP